MKLSPLNLSRGFLTSHRGFWGSYSGQGAWGGEKHCVLSGSTARGEGDGCCWARESSTGSALVKDLTQVAACWNVLSALAFVSSVGLKAMTAANTDYFLINVA